ncbi:MAG: iron ABC transporter permease [Eubacteriales bacterium]|nr:iron ABC transporter permease [Eubacteriales bacterium]
MKHKNYIQYTVTFVLLILLLVILCVWNINAGSVSFSKADIWNILWKQSGDETAYHIIWDIRMPRIVAAMLLGGALSVSGFLLQTFFGNPIAGPFVLGISSGAKLSVALVMIWLLHTGMMTSSTVLISAAFIGSMCAMGFVLFLSKKVPNMAMLVICGVMIGYICSAITDFVVTFADDSNIVNLHNWSLGSFSGINWANVKTIAVVVCVSVVFTFMLSKPMSAYQMGEAYARNVGVNITTFRVKLILLSSLLAACVTAFAGPISFVGIAVPHLMKGMLKTTKPILMIPASFIGGAVFCLFCDLIARTVFAPIEMSISSVTAIFGAPVVIYIMMQRQKRKG